VAERIPSVEEWVDKLIAEAPPVTAEQREIAVRLLVMPPKPASTVQRRSSSRRAA
jgi:hypothetical protein